ncbi:ribosomal protein S5 domain 2-type protein [Lipomyces tetrasporus]|uniref:Ribosomal protein S5 domain 2-type protein n=1 Tax=Lipomyces tetrasporus TaxID=54092 RepID=A0AAD7QY81_9ASCO|nr:ribosomal protein S5 domain 2-type protein [Lipomyces tetrasporus]KAJ8102017.1 ribosomal protein S5 domain 2-type protein [Lipomyces tetrasporus]
MPRDLTPSTIENTFVLKALTERIRLDSRSFNQLRDLDISFSSTEYGVVDVKLGRTRVIARISAEITQPYADRPYDGLFIIATEISPMAAPTFEAGRKSEDELVISRIVEKSIRRSGALDTESLCIISGEKCWAVRADVHFLDHDGGLMDAACIAVSAGLLHFRRPDITIEGVGSRREVIVHPITERVPVPLAVLHVPVCVTFSFFDVRRASSAISGRTRNDEAKDVDDDDVEEEDDSSVAVLVDATLQEELLRHGYMSVTANTNREICQIQKGGDMPVDVGVLLSCSEAAIMVAEKVTKLINKRLKEDGARRNVGNLLVEARAENDR